MAVIMIQCIKLLSVGIFQTSLISYVHNKINQRSQIPGDKIIKIYQLNLINRISFIHLHRIWSRELIEGINEIGFRRQEEGKKKVEAEKLSQFFGKVERMINLCPKQKWVKDILKGRMCL
jgi:hypothetical protein